MNEAVEVTGRAFNFLTHLVIAIVIKDVSDQVQSVLVMLNVDIETCKIEAVGDIVFVDLAKVFVATGCNELETIS